MPLSATNATRPGGRPTGRPLLEVAPHKRHRRGAEWERVLAGGSPPRPSRTPATLPQDEALAGRPRTPVPVELAELASEPSPVEVDQVPERATDARSPLSRRAELVRDVAPQPQPERVAVPGVAMPAYVSKWSHAAPVVDMSGRGRPAGHPTLARGAAAAGRDPSPERARSRHGITRPFPKGGERFGSTGSSHPPPQSQSAYSGGKPCGSSSPAQISTWTA